MRYEHLFTHSSNARTHAFSHIDARRGGFERARDSNEFKMYWNAIESNGQSCVVCVQQTVSYLSSIINFSRIHLIRFLNRSLLFSHLFWVVNWTRIEGERQIIWKWEEKHSPSLFMPICRHFFSRHAWHWLRCALSTMHRPVPAWHL